MLATAINFSIAFPHAADLLAPLKYKHPPLFQMELVRRCRVDYIGDGLSCSSEEIPDGCRYT
jgi:hypothetical protein